MWSENSFFKMMKVNNKIFGNDILNYRDDVCNDVLIQYFEKQLSKILDYVVLVNTDFVDVRYSGKGDVDGLSLKDCGFGLSVQQCVDIGNYIIGKCYIPIYSTKPHLPYFDSLIVVNYILYGYSLSECSYNLIYRNKTD